MKGVIRVSNETIVKESLNLFINFDFTLDGHKLHELCNLNMRKTWVATQNRKNRNKSRQRYNQIRRQKKREQRKNRQSDVAVVCLNNLIAG